MLAESIVSTRRPQHADCWKSWLLATLAVGNACCWARWSMLGPCPVNSAAINTIAIIAVLSSLPHGLHQFHWAAEEWC